MAELARNRNIAAESDREFFANRPDRNFRLRPIIDGEFSDDPRSHREHCGVETRGRYGYVAVKNAPGRRIRRVVLFSPQQIDQATALIDDDEFIEYYFKSLGNDWREAVDVDDDTAKTSAFDIKISKAARAEDREEFAKDQARRFIFREHTEGESQFFDTLMRWHWVLACRNPRGGLEWRVYSFDARVGPPVSREKPEREPVGSTRPAGKKFEVIEEKDIVFDPSQVRDEDLIDDGSDPEPPPPPPYREADLAALWNSETHLATSEGAKPGHWTIRRTVANDNCEHEGWLVYQDRRERERARQEAQSREQPKAEDWEIPVDKTRRVYDEDGTPRGPYREKADASTAKPGEAPARPALRDPSTFTGEITRRESYWPGIPVGKVTILTGDGGVGKTLLAQLLATASVFGLDCLGRPTRKGRVFALFSEDDHGELLRRQRDACAALGRSMADLAGDLKWWAEEDQADAGPLITFNGREAVRTEAFEALRSTIADFKPGLVILDHAAALFGGNELDRGQVTQFIKALRSLCVEFGVTIVLLAHPSIQGMAERSGRSGSTGWANAVRSRLYLTRPDDAPEDTPYRVLRTTKANYGPKGDAIDLVWARGTFQLAVDGNGNPVNREGAADSAMLEALRHFTKTGKSVSGSQTSPTRYAAKLAAGLPSSAGFTIPELVAALERMVARGEVYDVERRGKGRKPEKVLELRPDLVADRGFETAGDDQEWLQ